jgi:hypothetical protein
LYNLLFWLFLPLLCFQKKRRERELRFFFYLSTFFEMKTKRSLSLSACTQIHLCKAIFFSFKRKELCLRAPSNVRRKERTKDVEPLCIRHKRVTLSAAYPHSLWRTMAIGWRKERIREIKKCPWEGI